MMLPLALLLLGDLHAAARAGDLETVQALLEKGAAVNEYDQLGGTPLHDAAWNGDPAILSLLLDRLDHYLRHRPALVAHIAAWL